MAIEPAVVQKGYPGSKAGSGVAERIIRQMPPHKVYAEVFAGHAAVFRRKLPAEINYLVDCDHRVVHWLRSNVERAIGRHVSVVNRDALDWLDAALVAADKSWLVYCDPPYLSSVRTRLFYDYEFDTEHQHVELLKRLFMARCLVMVSGYAAELYETYLKGWRRVDIPTMTRGGARVECVWCNFPAPELLHDPRWAGKDFRERERIKRKRARWEARFAAMPGPERQVIAEALAQADPAAAAAAIRTAAADRTRPAEWPAIARESRSS